MMNRKSKILYIEDNLADTELVRIFLAEQHFPGEFKTTTTLKEGMEMLAEGTNDLLLLNLSLPDSIGFSTIQTFTEKFPKHPFIVITGNTSPVARQRSMEAGARGFLVKGTFSAKELINTINYATTP